MNRAPKLDGGRFGLAALAMLIWLGVGVMLSSKGVRWLLEAWRAPEVSGAAVILSAAFGAVIGLVKGRYVLSKSALRNRERLARLPGPIRPWQVFAPGFYLLIALMMSAGFGILRPLADAEGFTGNLISGGLYCGIGAALFISAFAYAFPRAFERPNPWREEPAAARLGRDGKVGVLLANLGTPDAPTPKAVARFLREFLSDPRVIEVPKVIWAVILNAFIIPLRKHSSAALYQRVFTDEGSPLLTIGRAQAAALQRALGEDVSVKLGMRYGTPSITAAIEELKAEGCDRILTIPAYPQYSATTTASIMDAVSDAARAWRLVPTLRFAPPYPDDPGYIEALAALMREAAAGAEVEHWLLSYHGIPVEYARRGDPYAAQCVRTTRALVEAMGLPEGGWTHCYQSQFGRDKWLGPATDEVLRGLAARGVKRVAVICPAFLVDCLETIDEIGHESRKLFLEAGGEELRLVPCLNDDPRWVEALAAMCRRELGGWVAAPTPAPAPEPEMEEVGA